MKKVLSIIFLLTISCNILFAQDSTITERKRPTKGDYNFREHLFTGGGFIVNIGSYVTAIGIQPLVGYKFNDRLAAGINANYIYYRESYGGVSYSTSIYGGGLFGRYKIFEEVFAHAEPGFTNFNVPTFDKATGHYTTKRQNVPYLLLGGGYAQEIGSGSYLEIMVLYDVLYDSARSFTGSPLVFRAGFNFGL